MTLESTFFHLGSLFSTKVQPQPLDNPRLVSRNPDFDWLVQDLGLSPEQLTSLCNGEYLPQNAKPCAMVYAGHQFGSWVPQLGDGRALLLGEVRDANNTLLDLQIKGSGLTPYSRNGDGRAVLRSTIREYLCSEAIHALGIPTTRSLCMIDSDTPVYREKTETGAAMIRVSESFVRFGTFEFFSYSQQYDALQTLTDYVIDRHFTAWSGLEDRVECLLAEVVKRTAHMIAHWQAVGWCHGVMNTDNMSILGLTIDYGPFGFLDGFDAGHICNHSDWQGRYAFSKQPHIGHWNCAALAQALLPLLQKGNSQEGKVAAEKILDSYPEQFAERYSQLLRAKFGLKQPEQDDSKLIDVIFQLMQEEKTDYTLFFRNLSEGKARDLFRDRSRFDTWFAHYQERLGKEQYSPADIQQNMVAVNPKYVLRNHLLQVAIDKAEAGDYSEVNKLLSIIRQPFSEQPDNKSYADYPPDWASQLEVSCSS